MVFHVFQYQPSQFVEPRVDSSTGKEPHVPFLVLVGESLERLSGGWHASCVHRVKHSEVGDVGGSWDVRSRWVDVGGR